MSEQNVPTPETQEIKTPEAMEVRQQIGAPPEQVDKQRVTTDVALQLTAGVPMLDKLDPHTRTELDGLATKLVDQLTKRDVDKQDKRTAVDNYGVTAQRDSAGRAKMLDIRVRDLKKLEGGPVADSLKNLEIFMEKYDPAKFDMAPGFLARWFGFLPGVGQSMKSYILGFNSAGTLLQAIEESIIKSQQTLERDNITMAEDQKVMLQDTIRLRRLLLIGQMADQKIQERLNVETDPEEQRFIKEELLFPLRQRVQDIQTMIAVNTQGLINNELMIRVNRELIRAAERGRTVSISALRQAVVTSIVLYNQQIAIAKVKGLADTTDQMMLANARKLRAQTAEVQTLAAREVQSREVIKEVFGILRETITEFSNFKVEALTTMDLSIKEMNQVIDEADKTYKQLEKGRAAQTANTLLDDPNLKQLK
jgi:uncharacterized protein YaaN involved in tellurite resistance